MFVAYCGVWKAQPRARPGDVVARAGQRPAADLRHAAPVRRPGGDVIAALGNVRRLPWYGLVASAVAVLVAVPDLDRVRRLGIVELAIAVAAALVSVAGFSGTYRRVATP